MGSPVQTTSGEAQRLAALRDMLVLDSPPEPLFDNLARMASELCGTPIALLTLVDERRQWFKAKVGLEGVDQTPREVAFCAHAIGGEALFEVPDARLDDRFASNPLVQGEPHIRFYAGMPLVVDGGARIGTLCVIDRQARQLTAAQAQSLRQLAELATQALVMRRDLITRALQVRNEQEQALARSEARYRGLVEQQTDCISLARPDGQLLYVNPAYARQFGQTQQSLTGSNLLDIVDPADRQLVEERFARLLRGEGPFDGVNRNTGADGSVRWIAWTNSLQHDEHGAALIHSVGRDITESRRMSERLAETTAQLNDLYDNAPCGYHSLDANGRFLQANALTLAWLGLPREQVLGQLGPTDFFTEAGRSLFRLVFPVFKAEGRLGPIEFELLGRDGTRRWVSLTASAVYDEQGRFVMSRSVMYDITEVHEARTELRRLAAEQNAMLDSELVGIVKLRNGVAIWKNRALERMFGYGPDELLGAHGQLLFAEPGEFDRLRRDAVRALRTQGRHRLQLRLRRKNGDLVWVDASGAPLSPDSDESLWVLADISQLKDYQTQVEHIAFHDALTGLPNRWLLADRMQQAIAAAERAHCQVAVCFLDLDGFKAVNDESGHEAGDQLLRQVARRIQAAVRAGDTVARLGGDEFVLLLAPVSSPDDWEPVLQRVVDAVRAPVPLAHGGTVSVSASVGVALYPAHGTAAPSLLSHADAALYQAKRAGKNRISLYWSGPDAAPDAGVDASADTAMDARPQEPR